MQDYPWPNNVVPSQLLFLEEWDPFLQSHTYRWPLDLQVKLSGHLYHNFRSGIPIKRLHAYLLPYSTGAIPVYAPRAFELPLHSLKES